MESELFRNLVSDPGRWPYYIAFAAVIWFVFKLVGFASEAAWSHLKESIKRRSVLRRIAVSALQIAAISIAVYFFNLLFWSKRLSEVLDSPPVIATHLSALDKALVTMGYQVQHENLGRNVNVARTQERLNELGKLPPEVYGRLMSESHQNLVRLKLIEDLPISPAAGNKFSLLIGLTPLGEKVFCYLRDKNQL